MNDFELANADSDLNPVAVPMAQPGTGGAARTDEEIRVGKAAAKVLTDSLIQELSSRGIAAQRATGAAPPELNTLSIRGRFLWRDKEAGTMRARVWYYQAPLSTQSGGAIDADIPSESKSGAKVGNSGYTAAQEPTLDAWLANWPIG